MPLVPYKFQILPICQVLDADGHVVAEQPVGRRTPAGDVAPIEVFGVAALKAWADALIAQLAQIDNASVDPAKGGPS